MKEIAIGDYGKVAKVDSTAMVAGEVLAADEKYIVKAIDGTASVIPSGGEVGYVFEALGDEVLATDDEVYHLVETDACDISGFSLEWSRDEIDGTTLCDDVKKYVAGMADVSGSISGLYKLGTTDAADGWANKFVDIVSQDGAGGDVTVSKIDNSPVVLVLYVQDSKSTGETETFYIVPAELMGWSTGVSVGSNSPFESSLRVSAADSGIEIQCGRVIR